MGLILDSSVLITAEREGQNARQMLAAVSGKAGNTEIAISVVTLIELAHGAARADTPQRKAKRQQFIQELLMAMPIHPVTVSVALRTGQIDGENQAKGIRLPLSDLLIGVTALELGYSVATGNLRHFQMIPGLPVVRLLFVGRCLDCVIPSSAVGFAAMMYAANLDGVGIGADEEEPVVANAQPKLFSSLESVHVARARFRKAMQRRENVHGGGLA